MLRIMRIGAQERHVSREHSLAIGSFVPFSIHWWTVMKRDKKCSSAVRPLGLNAQLTTVSCVTLGKAAHLTVPHCSIYQMEMVRGHSFWRCLKI